VIGAKLPRSAGLAVLVSRVEEPWKQCEALLFSRAQRVIGAKLPRSAGLAVLVSRVEEPWMQCEALLCFTSAASETPYPVLKGG